MDVIKRGVWIRLGREHAFVVAKQFIPEVNCEIKLPRIKVGLQYKKKINSIRWAMFSYEFFINFVNAIIF